MLSSGVYSKYDLNEITVWICQSNLASLPWQLDVLYGHILSLSKSLKVIERGSFKTDPNKRRLARLSEVNILTGIGAPSHEQVLTGSSLKPKVLQKLILLN